MLPIFVFVALYQFIFLSAHLIRSGPVKALKHLKRIMLKQHLLGVNKINTIVYWLQVYSS